MDPFYDVCHDATQQLEQLSGYVSRLTDVDDAAAADFDNNRAELVETIRDLHGALDRTKQDPESFGVTREEIAKREASLAKLNGEFDRLLRLWAQRDQRRPREITSVSNRISHEDERQFVQQEVMREQDEQLDVVYRSIQNLNMQATAMGDELDEQNYMIRDLENEMERVGSKLGNGMRRIQWFLEKNNEKASNCCIGLLIVVLVILLVLLMI
ncbi:unnamed protein product [Kuraishia capsulata CBS 1993]|uniref:t-SNARE affecting a late Golgi compartment protein 1 n=1 Tax=Kuraishia capsulata CBS 1993 TaxID=1382522 RepID=W6MXP4_9ASCO|nr:uncharacterized protein KUCA_T00005233001 [Kuraishia capsulata CBS 1993]CDK29245.1 unnamed protein product [Kuraishia capsulata CBS 1993]